MAVVWLLLACLWSVQVSAAILPEDRADALYHAYSGGGVTVDGPSVLVRKGFKDKVSVYANYYIDMVSSASIDVLSSGSKYTEERTEYSVGGEYLIDRTILSLGYGKSNESDYTAETTSVGISQEFFGSMSTLSMGFSQGDDIIRQNQRDGPAIEVGELKRRRFTLSWTQVLTKSLIAAVNTETIVDDGFLRNPYRQVRVLGETDQFEIYPETRNSDAASLRLMYYLPYRASIRLEGRYFSDSWGIKASNYEIRYMHPLKENWTFEVKLRTYSQTQADFYQDLFVFPQGEARPAFLGRDKELSTYQANNFGFGVAYERASQWKYFTKESVSFFWDYMQFDYDNFRNRLLSRGTDTSPAQFAVGEEPFYGFNANVVRLFVSLYY